MRAVVAVLLAAALAGCGASEPGAPEAETTATATATATPGTGPGRLSVHLSLPEGPVFIEGSVTRLRLVDAAGDEVVDDLYPGLSLDEPLLVKSLPPGRYHLEALERPCSGTCDHLDPPSHGVRCETALDIRAGRATKVHLRLHPAPLLECGVSP